MRTLVQNMKDEKIDLEYNLEQSELKLTELNTTIAEINTRRKDQEMKIQQLKKTTTLAAGRIKDLESQLNIVNETAAKQKMELAGVASMKNAANRVNDLTAQLTVQTKRANAAQLASKDCNKKIQEADHAVNQLQKTVSALEARLEEEKEKTKSLTLKSQQAAKGVADLGANNAKLVAETETRMRRKYKDEIDSLKTKNNEALVQQNMLLDDLRSKLTQFKMSNASLQKQVETLQQSQNNEISNSSSKKKNQSDLIESLKTQRKNQAEQLERLQELQQQQMLQNSSDSITALRSEINRLQLQLKEAQNNVSKLTKNKLDMLRKNENLEVSTRISSEKEKKIYAEYEEKTEQMNAIDLKRMAEIQKYKQDIRHYQGMMARLGIEFSRPPTPPMPINAETQTLMLMNEIPSKNEKKKRRKKKKKMRVISSSSSATTRQNKNERKEGESSEEDEDEKGDKYEDEDANTISQDIQKIDKDGTIYIDRCVSPFFNHEENDYFYDDDDEYRYINKETNERGIFKDPRNDDDDNNNKNNSASGNIGVDDSGGADIDKGNNNQMNEKGDGWQENENSSSKSTKRKRKYNKTRNNNESDSATEDMDKNKNNKGTSISENSVHDVTNMRSSNVSWSRQSQRKDRTSSKSPQSRSDRSRNRSRTSSRRSVQKNSENGENDDDEKEDSENEQEERNVVWEESRSRTSSYKDASGTPMRMRKVNKVGVGRIIVDEDCELLGFPPIRLPRPKIINIGEGSFSPSERSMSSWLEKDNGQHPPPIDSSSSGTTVAQNRSCQHVAVQTTQHGGVDDHGVALSSYLMQKKEANTWKHRVWELQQITYLMDTLVPAREFYRTRAGIGDTSEASIRYYEKPNTTPPPLHAVKDLLWLLHREICASRTLQAIDNWQYLKTKLELLQSRKVLKQEAENAMQQARALQKEHEDNEWKELQKLEQNESMEPNINIVADTGENKKDCHANNALKLLPEKKKVQWKKEQKATAAHGLIAAAEKWGKASDSAARIWEQRRVMFEASRKRRWEQCLDSMITLSNYSNSVKTSAASRTNVSTTSFLPIDSESMMMTTSNVELLKSMIPFLPVNLQTFGTEKAAKLLLEITHCVRSASEKRDEQSKSSMLSDTVNSAGPHTSSRDVGSTDIMHQYSSSSSLRLQSTPFLMRKETEWWNSKAQSSRSRSRSRSRRSGSTRSKRTPHVPQSASSHPLQSPRTIRTHRIEKRPLELTSSSSSIPSSKKLPSVR